jgi:primosomal protein N' (replication factor Y)
MPEILRVALPVPLPRLFDYLPPGHGKALPGCRVRVPFGRGRRIGLIVARGEHSSWPADQLKHIHAVIDDTPLFGAELLDSLRWAGDYWLGAPGEVVFGALPVALRGAKAPPETGIEAWSITEVGQTELAAGKRRGRSRALLETLGAGTRTAQVLDGELSGWRAAARRLARAGLLERTWLAPADLPRPAIAGPPLNPHQQQAVDAVLAAGTGFHALLLDGVTGSGKTEVYLTLARRALARGRQVLLLVPEIGLTPQSVRRLRERLGTDVDVLHSGLAAGERARAWWRARKGEARVIVGTRSAVFTPLPRAGLILVDEEHDSSYKQHEGFRYHARDLAIVRARALGVPIVLGSATPSLETLANVAAGRYQRLHLPRRTGVWQAPRIQVIDIRSKRLQHGLSAPLIEAIGETVARDEQVLVFRNRRGYAPILMCHACGWHARCPRCDRPMTLHAGRQRLACHHCGREQRIPVTCPDCGEAPLRARGFGTERLEEALKARFADVPVHRVDRESIRRHGAFDTLLEGLDEGRAAILIGTQILAKGHDLANLTLVAITSVDEGLFSVDFRASERLAQLVVQVAGRAGRARKPGRVLLQTHQPDHPFLHILLEKGYAGAAQELIEERRVLQLPPFASQALLRAEDGERDRVNGFLTAAREALRDPASVRVLGPMPAPMPLRAGRHRGQLLLEADRRGDLKPVLHAWHGRLWELPEARRVRWSIDVDPVDLY